MCRQSPESQMAPRLFILATTMLAIILNSALAPTVSVAADEDAKSAAATEKSNLPTKPAKLPKFVAIKQIVIRHKESRGRRDQRPDRTKGDARKRAEEALARARRPDVRFRDVMEKYSDDVAFAIKQGGVRWDRANLYQELDRTRKFKRKFRVLGDALFSIEEGQVSDIVESPFGFHILMRIPVVEYCASQIVVQYKGAKRSTRSKLDGETGDSYKEDKTDRTQEEARKLTAEIVEKLKRKEATFEELARAHSDDESTKKYDGYIGTFLEGWMTPELEAPLKKIKVGEVTVPIETAFGFHILRREKIERIRVSHIKVTYKGAKRYPRKVTRSREQAKQRIEKVETQLKDGADFAELARKFSDQNQDTGGDWGFLGRNRIPVPEVEKRVWELNVGETSEIIDAEHGFYIVRRTE